MDSLNIVDALGMQITRKRDLPDLFNPKGIFIVEHIRGGQVIKRWEEKNTVVNEGKNHILGVAFNGVTQITTWYMGLIDNASFSSVQATDTMASHTGWTEFTTYSQGTRPEWDAVAPVNQSITNSTAVTFDITGSGTLRGAFIVSANTKGGTGGVLWCGVTYSSTVAVANGDQIKNTYTITT